MADDMSLLDALAERSSTQDVPGYRKKLRACREALLADRGLEHLAHYTGGVLDFAVDVLAHGASSPGLPEEQTEARREVLRRTGAHLVFRMGQLDRRLRNLRSGALIRLVVHGERGSVFGNLVLQEQHLMAFAHDPEPAAAGATALTRQPYVRSADRAASELATRLRELVSQTTLNPGGWLTAPTDGSGELSPSGAGVDTAAGAVTRGAPGDTMDLLRGIVRADTVQYAAYHRYGEQLCAADVLDDPSITSFFDRLISPEDRRGLYDRLGADLGMLALQLGGDTEDTLGEVRRFVLDVEQGAIYCYRLRNNDHLVGVTIDQNRVSQADDALAGIALTLDRELN
jgi:hypothetical protein